MLKSLQYKFTKTFFSFKSSNSFTSVTCFISCCFEPANQIIDFRLDRLNTLRMLIFLFILLAIFLQIPSFVIPVLGSDIVLVDISCAPIHWKQLTSSANHYTSHCSNSSVFQCKDTEFDFFFDVSVILSVISFLYTL